MQGFCKAVVKVAFLKTCMLTLKPKARLHIFTVRLVYNILDLCTHCTKEVTTSCHASLVNTAVLARQEWTLKKVRAASQQG